jgi:molybdate transport system ATP-binding protein
MLTVNIEKDLADFRLRIAFELDNRILVLWGPSGAGKTTTLECLAGLRKPDRGEIMLQEQVLYSSSARLDLPARLRHIGYLFQDHNLFPHMTVEQNIKYGIPKIQGKQRTANHRELMEQFGIQHLGGRYPHQISGGERQRAALIRALVTEPRLLLLDEPFSSLDQQAHVSLRDTIRELHAQWNIPVIVVTHDQGDAEQLGHTVITLDRGAQIAAGQYPGTSGDNSRQPSFYAGRLSQ